MGDQAAKLPDGRIWFWGLLALAIVLRAVQFDPFAMHHPDEVLQYLEPAHRLLTGEGIVTWEYRYGMRGWLLPVLLAGPMALGKAIGGTALAGIIAARIFAAAVCLLPVVAAWHLGRRLSLGHGIIAMAVMAVWYEQVVYSTHLLTESLSAALFLGAAAIIHDKASRGRIMAGGALLALAVILRFQFSVAAGVFVLLALEKDWKRWRWLILGALPVVAASSLVDAIMGQWPFEWMWTNVQLNLIEGRSARFGVEEPAFFVKAIWGQWGWLMPVIVVLAVESGKPYRPLLLAAAFNLAVHMLIAHKEYRFIELTSATFVLLAAIGSVNVLRRLEARRGKTFPALAATGSLILAWAGASAWIGQDKPLDRWFGERGSGPELAYLAGRDPRVCGVGIMAVEFWQFSYVYLGRPVPIILLPHTKRPWPKLRAPGPEILAVNAVYAPVGSESKLPGYSVSACKGEMPFRRCLYRRPGGCTMTPEAQAQEVQAVLIRVDS